MSTPETTPAPVAISKAERDIIFNAVGLIAPALTKTLGRDYFVADEADCVLWTAHVESFLGARVKEEQAIAGRLRGADERRGIPKRITFQAADAARADLADFKAALERVRKEADEKAVKREAEREAKGQGGGRARGEGSRRRRRLGSREGNRVTPAT